MGTGKLKKKEGAEMSKELPEKMHEYKFKANDPRTKAAQSKGGKKSAETKKFRRDVQKLLDAAPFKSKTFEQLKKLLGDNNDITIRYCIIASMAEKAAKGDVQASIFLRDTAGEKPKEEIEHSGGVVFMSGEDEIAD